LRRPGILGRREEMMTWRMKEMNERDEGEMKGENDETKRDSDKRK
jgi:hypothetical protein